MGIPTETITDPGIAPPKFDPDEARGSALHREMLDLAYPKYKGSWFKYRERLLGRYRRLKLGYLAGQPRALSRARNTVIYLAERYRVGQVHYLPPLITMDPNNACNLRCPGCTTGLADPTARHKGLANLDLMQDIIERVSGKTIQVNFYNWGEPLLNREVFSACAFAAKLGLWTTIHSNLSIRVPGLAESVLDSKLCNLVVSCDGATQETYEKYRVRGNVDLVFENLRAIVAERTRRRTQFPWITAKFLVFDHNWHEMKLFRDRALAVGADEILFAAAGMGGPYRTKRIATGQDFDLKLLKWTSRPASPRCHEIWESLTFDHDGAVFPCCMTYRDRDLFFNPEQTRDRSIMELWNDEKLQSMRSFFLGKSDIAVKDLPAPCATCMHCASVEETRSRTGSRDSWNG